MLSKFGKTVTVVPSLSLYLFLARVSIMCLHLSLCSPGAGISLVTTCLLSTTDLKFQANSGKTITPVSITLLQKRVRYQGNMHMVLENGTRPTMGPGCLRPVSWFSSNQLIFDACRHPLVFYNIQSHISMKCTKYHTYDIKRNVKAKACALKFTKILGFYTGTHTDKCFIYI